ncbi:terpene synthase family protein [Streptomyces alanosinicus]|uniref:Terpene synthase n=1 Tax=Streptomyces alanosinicus TaxID=68171 RepID=A0A918YRN7_9ACTN|nr:hypothetical protein [Streptomyces alanosinicus]GHE12922.1 hypothetical protein GCM10010339_78160 [Streptomyces alanosinicus]
MSAVRLPPFYLPAPELLSPHAEMVDREAARWLDRFALGPDRCDALSRAEVGSLAAALAPCGELAPLQLIADFLMWNIAFDDECCDEGPLSSRPLELADMMIRLLRVVESPEIPPSGHYDEALYDLRTRLSKHGSPAQVARWTEAVRAWFLAELWKAGNVARGVVPTLSDFLVQRLYSGGGFVCTVMVSIAEGYEVPEQVMADRRIRALTEMAILAGNGYTDITSHARERHDGQGSHNLVDVLCREQECGPERGLVLAADLLNRVTALFVRLRDDVATTADDTLRRYLASLSCYVSAAARWTLTSARYRYPSQQALGPAFEPGGWVGAPEDTTPLPIPSMAWWWQHDPLSEPAPRAAPPPQ